MLIVSNFRHVSLVLVVDILIDSPSCCVLSSYEFFHLIPKLLVLHLLVRCFFLIHFDFFCLDLKLLLQGLGIISPDLTHLSFLKLKLKLSNSLFQVAILFDSENMLLVNCEKLGFDLIELVPQAFELSFLFLICSYEGFRVCVI